MHVFFDVLFAVLILIASALIVGLFTEFACSIDERLAKSLNKKEDERNDEERKRAWYGGGE